MGNSNFTLMKINQLKDHFIYGFDLHGVITTDPEGYKHIFKLLRSKGHKIYIISGPSKIDLSKELHALGINRGLDYDRLLSVVDFLKEKGVKMWQNDKGSWWAGDIDWWSAKAQICKTYGVDYMFDDTHTYKQFFRGTGCKFVHINVPIGWRE